MLSSIMIYTGGLLCVYISAIISTLSRHRFRALVILAISIIGSIAIFRGQVGTDTAMYEAIIEMSRDQNYNWEGREPGFTIIADMLTPILQSNEIIVRAYSAIFVILLIAIAARADRDELFFITCYFIPAQFFDYSMNIIRVGLASMLLLLAIQAFRRKRGQTNGLMHLIASCAFHYSMVFSVIYIYASTLKLSTRRLIYLGFALAGLGAGAYFLLDEYIALKAMAYSDYKSSGEFSGLADAIVIILVMIGGAASSLKNHSKLAFLLITSIFLLFSLALSRQTIAGTRLLDLLVVSTPAALLILHGQQEKLMNSKLKIALFTAGAFCALATLRNFLNTAGQDRSPWIPYEFIFS